MNLLKFWVSEKINHLMHRSVHRKACIACTIVMYSRIHLILNVQLCISGDCNSIDRTTTISCLVRLPVRRYVDVTRFRIGHDKYGVKLSGQTHDLLVVHGRTSSCQSQLRLDLQLKNPR